MFFIYPTPQYPRRKLEYVFKSLYLIANLVHVTSLVVLMSDFYTRLSNSMPEYYRQTDLVISDSITLVMQNCVYNGSIHLGNVRGSVQVTIGNIGYGLMTTAQYVTGLFVLEFLLLVNNCFVALNYSKGNRHLRLFGVHVPLYHITVMMTQVYCIAICVVMWSFDGNRRFFQSALKYCAAEMRRSNYEQLLSSEFDDYTIFSTAVYWPFAATCVSEMIYFSAAIVLCWFSEDDAIILLSEADAPWESRGVLCNTYKPLLKLHTAQRNAIIEDARNAIKEGQKVRIVRSYQLMTEEDFEALVQAMREQVAKALKEKQFEKLKENFGDHESQIDNMGFAWRENMMVPPPVDEEDGVLGSGQDGGPADQFFDVPFDEYFTDNEMNENARDQLGGGGGNGPDTVYNDDQLLFDPAYGPDGNGGGYYNDNAGYGFDGDDAVGTQDAWTPQEGEYPVMDGQAEPNNEVYDPEPASRISHSHHRRRHRHSRTRDDVNARDAEDDYGMEPDPRLPPPGQRGYDDGNLDASGGGGAFNSGPAYYDTNDDMMMYGGGGGASRGGYNPRSQGGGGGDRPNYGTNGQEGQRQRSNRGRQAGVEQNDEEADELSDAFGH
ncbi:hypothetical protein ABB37_03663 [Leptomonas pyrrhocoris]|uniref:Uncharacterized protein n=1 Tax=Leptomonas pyrrhocoris TaxID=157538 RepID=A0A0M9G2V7_LEPPY|nr:hypothetical protein ABB37_03663 [Leptomonas pyrrhocoris]KPA81245.1 hypothetical protein ABB37_03663 [Leptomonas pyrrhocoris]|eukprot:XP_015659684.1 hypothetical protein ABB37_03663 [Leptomonas pyrrhocoris]